MSIDGLNSQNVNQNNNKHVQNPANPHNLNFDVILGEMFSAGMFEDVDIRSLKNKKKKLASSIQDSVAVSESSAIGHGIQVFDKISVDSIDDLEVDRSFYHKALGLINKAIKQLLPHSDLA